MIAHVQCTRLVRVASLRDDGSSNNQAVLSVRIRKHKEQMQPHSSIANEKRCASLHEVHNARALPYQLRKHVVSGERLIDGVDIIVFKPSSTK